MGGIKEAVVRHVRDLTFVGKTETNHWTIMDASHHGSIPGANSPMELLLLALGGCTGSDVASILEKKRVVYQSLEIRVKGERAATDPKVYTSIHVEYVLTGEKIPENEVKHAIDLSVTKYCSVSAMLGKTAKITHSHSIVRNGELAAKEGG
ncbi:MAG TPA: OsmC family protein [Bacteroidota bacterium]|nr:OsmC family protein [Bacteroidota bacterium]